MANIKKDIDLQFTNTFFRGVLNLAGIGIMTLRSDRSIHFANLEALKIFGYKPKELNGIIFNTLFQDESQEHLEDILLKINSFETNYNSSLESTGLHKDNSVIPVELTISCDTSD